MPTVKGLRILDPSGKTLGFQAECPICGEQAKRSCLGNILSECVHHRDMEADPTVMPVMFRFEETDDDQDRERERETNNRILEELEERR